MSRSELLTIISVVAIVFTCLRQSGMGTVIQVPCGAK